MDLGSRVKKALFDPEGTVASHGEEDIHKTPGAYPDTPVNESGPDSTTNNPGTGSSSSKPTHNKLHKPEDPRGWVGDTKAGLSHKHADSGVGFTEEHDTSPTRQTGDYTHRAQDTQNTTSGGLGAVSSTAATQDVGQQHQQHDGTQLSRATGDADVQNSHDDSYRGASLGSGGIVPLLDSHRDDEMREDDEAYHHHNHGATSTSTTKDRDGDSDANKTRQPGDVVQDHPYWGDLPRGGGVYNSVTGHGSEEDQRKRQQELYQQETAQRETQGLSGQHPSTVASLSDSRDTPHSHQQTTGLGDSYRDSSRVGERDNNINNNNNNREALIGAGGAATASAAAATAYKMHERDNINNKTVQDPAREEYPSGDNKERRRSFGLFHRSNKEDDHQHHHAKEKVKEDRTKHVDEPKTEKKHSFGGLFHRNSGDKETAHDESGARDLKRDDNSNTAAYTMAGAGLGAGGAVAYMGSRDRKDTEDRDEVRDRSTIGGQQHQPHHHQQPSVGAHDHHQTQTQTLGGTHTQPQRQYQQDQPHQATRGLDEQYDTQNNSRDMTAAAAAAAAGLGAGAGAGALAYRHRDEKANEPREETIKSRHQVTPGDHTLRHTSHASNNLTGNVNPLVGSTRDPQTQRQPPPLTGRTNRDDYSRLSSGTASGVDPTVGSSSLGTAHSSNNSNQAPTLTEHANRGDYGHLSSGTASGVGAVIGSSTTSARDTHSDNKNYDNEKNPTLAEHANHGGYKHLTSGTTSGVEPTTEPSSASSARTKQAPPALADHANHGEYNHLSSGTPSGVRLDNNDRSEDKNSASHNLQPSFPEAREGEHDNNNNNNNRLRNTAAAGTLAGVAGLGATAYQTRDRHHVGDDQNVERRELEKLKPAEEDQVKRYEREEARGDDRSQARSFPLVPGAAGSHHKSDKVIHRCQKCGEENDISSYFQRN